MTKRRTTRTVVLVTAATAAVVGFLAAGWAGHPMPVPVLAAVTVPAATVARTPCTATAKACVDLTTKHAWLIRDGKVIVGPVPINIGGPGERTPTGTFRVWRKDPHHISAEQHGTPMPYSVFFDRGVAFQSGPLALMSAGCVHLRLTDAMNFYRNLRLGDQVQVRATPTMSRQLSARPPGVRVLPPAVVTRQPRRPVAPPPRRLPS